MANFRLPLRNLGALSQPLSGGQVHRFIHRGPKPTVVRSAIGLSVYTVLIGPEGGGGLSGGPPIKYPFAWTDGTNWRIDETDQSDILWSDQIA